MKLLAQGLLPSGVYARNVSILMGGTVSAQLLTILAAPLLTRLYTQEDFGLLAVFISLLVLMSEVSSMRYELAVPLPDDDQEAANIVVLSLILVVISSLLAVLLVLTFGESIAKILGVPNLADYFWLLPLGVLFSGVYAVFLNWGIRAKRFTTIATTKLRQAVTTLGIQLSMYMIGGVALLIGQVFGQGAGVSGLAVSALKKEEFKRVDYHGLRRALIRYRRFPIFTTWAGLLNSGGTQLAPLIIAAFFTAATAGLYVLAHRVLTLPISLVGAALQNVFFSEAAESHRKKQLANKVRDLLNILTHVAVLPAIILAFWGPELFSLVFGQGWMKAGVLAQWMTPWLVMQFCTAPLTVVNVATENQHIGLIMQAQLFFVRVGAIIVGAYSGDIIYTIQLFSFGSAVSYFIFLYFILKVLDLSLVVFVRPLIMATFSSFVVLIPIFIYSHWFSGLVPLVVFSLISCIFLTIRVYIQNLYRI